MKRIVALLLVICTVLCLTACGGTVDSPVGNTTTPSAPTAATTPATAPTTAPTKTPLHQQNIPYTEFISQYGSYKQICSLIGTAWDSEVGLDIPVYYEEEILDPKPGIYLTRDSSLILKKPGEWGNGAIDQFYHFPTNALRMRADGTSYLVYDTETGYRLYVFIADVPYIMGYPMVINKTKMLEFDDFEDIKTGDSIEKVETIDDVTTFYIRNIENLKKSNTWSIKYLEIMAESGSPVVSVHYLTDGILQIEYTISEANNTVVSKMTFYEDYIIPTADGKLTSHKIHDMDLPIAK